MKKRPAPLQRKSGMNKLEQMYSEHLDSLKKKGVIVGWRFEPINFRLGGGATYKPDFMVTFPGHIEIHETKGFWREAARVRIKVASELFPEFRWLGVQLKGKEWSYEEF